MFSFQTWEDLQKSNQPHLGYILGSNQSTTFLMCFLCEICNSSTGTMSVKKWKIAKSLRNIKVVRKMEKTSNIPLKWNKKGQRNEASMVADNYKNSG